MFKKGFTLAEMLVVLAIIGVVAALTIPGMLHSSTEARYKSAYKKAYKTISDVTNVLLATGKLSSATSTAINADRMFWSLNDSLNVKNYAKLSLAGGAVPANSAIYTDFTMTNPYESTYTASTLKKPTSTAAGYWITTEDGMSYSVMNSTNTATGEKYSCSSKKIISAATSHDNAVKAACSVIIVDVNGIKSLPNKPATTAVASAGGHLDGDQFYIYVGTDGITAGNEAVLVSGRIFADAELSGADTTALGTTADATK